MGFSSSLGTDYYDARGAMAIAAIVKGPKEKTSLGPSLFAVKRWLSKALLPGELSPYSRKLGMPHK